MLVVAEARIAPEAPTATGPGIPAAGRPGRAARLAGRFGIAAVAVAAAAVGVWAAAPSVLSAAPTAAGTGAAGSARIDAGIGSSASTAGPTPAAPATPGSAVPGSATPTGKAPGTATPAAPATPAPQAATPPAPAAPSPPAAPARVLRGILPPGNPTANIPPSPNFLTVCSGTGVDETAACTQAALAAIDNGRAAEGLPAMVLPSDWSSLTPGQQLFVATNLERTVRGLAPLSGLDPALDQASAGGAASGADPAPPAGYPYQIWASNWAGALGNPLEAIDLWMYDDGPGSANVDCPSAGAPGCWGHRDNILVSLPCTSCAMGTALDPTGWNGDPAWAEMLVESQQPVQLAFTWSQVTPYLPANEA